MKVLHVLGELRASGAEVMLLAATPLMEDAGITTSVLSTGEQPGPYAQNYEEAGVRVLHAPFAKSPTFAMAFARLLRRERPDVVHIHTERANAAIAVLARLAGVRHIVRTVHNVFTFRGRLRFVRMTERACLRHLGVRHISIGPSVEHNELVTLRNPTIRIDNWLGPEFRPPNPEERLTARAGYQLADDALVIASIGNCSKVKNHAAILEALPAIVRATHRPVVYLHAGSGDEEVAERELAGRLRRLAEVRFLGTVRDVRPLLWATDVFCMPSLYEGLGMAALEALACATPTVLSAVPGLSDTHRPSASVKFGPPTADGVARGVVELLTAPTASVATAALQSAQTTRARYSHQVQVKKLAAFYQSAR